MQAQVQIQTPPEAPAQLLAAESVQGQLGPAPRPVLIALAFMQPKRRCLPYNSASKFFASPLAASWDSCIASGPVPSRTSDRASFLCEPFIAFVAGHDTKDETAENILVNREPDVTGIQQLVGIRQQEKSYQRATVKFFEDRLIGVDPCNK